MRTKRSSTPKFGTNDPDIIASYAALKRAAKKARELSIQLGTPFWVVDSKGKLVDLNAGRGGRASRRRAPGAATSRARRR